MPSDGLTKLLVEIRERHLGLETWIDRQPIDVAYGLAIVSEAILVEAEMDAPTYVIRDDEFRERARVLLPRDMRGGTVAGDGVLVVRPLR